MKLEKVEKMIAQQIVKVNRDIIKEDAEETELVPLHIKQQLPGTVQRYGARNESKHVINGKTIE